VDRELLAIEQIWSTSILSRTSPTSPSRALAMKGEFDVRCPKGCLRAPQMYGECARGSQPVRPSDRDLIILQFVGRLQKVRWGALIAQIVVLLIFIVLGVHKTGA
jgi:hypothetical protein